MMKMLKIKVEYKIWDIVEHSFNGAKYMVIWYQFIWPDRITYICSQSDKTEWTYFTSIELKKTKETFIWFTTDKCLKKS